MNLKEAYDYGVYFLSANGVDEPDFKSLCLVCHCAGIKNNEFRIHKNDGIIMKRFADLLWRVKNGEPLQYVLGKWDFYESEFFVGKGVLIPRPETEELTELVINHAKRFEKPVVIDLCSGSGCIGISVAKAVTNAEVFCVEKSADAYAYLLKNAENIVNVTTVNEDICDLPKLPDADIIVSNPPYIQTSELEKLQKEVRREPIMALDGGEDGLGFYRVISSGWKQRLKPDGYLFLEIGENQGGEVLKILEKDGWQDAVILKDMYNNCRMVKAVNR